MTSPTPRRVVIVGGGITGLAAAKTVADLAVSRGEQVVATLVEASGQLGGNIRTERVDGFTMDAGPDSWVASKPHATELAKSVGLEAALMPTLEASRRVYIAWGSGLHPLPEGLVLGIPTRIGPMVRSRLFSFAGKARMGLEPLIAARAWRDGADDDDDESIAAFVTRRLGREVSERLAAPLLGGIFAGDAARISVRAAFPQLVDAERRYGSLVRAMRAQIRDRQRRAGGAEGAKSPSVFLSLRGGMDTLVAAVAAAVATSTSRVALRTNTPVRAVQSTGGERGRYDVRLDGGEVLSADEIIFASPAHVTAALIRGLSPSGAAAAAALDELPFVSTATVFLGFRRADVAHALDAAGFIVPAELGRPILAGTWVSSKWESRAPEGHVLMRVFFGGVRGEALLQEDDGALARRALDELRALLGAMGEPVLKRVCRHVRASPQPLVGHLTRMRRLASAVVALPGVHVAGNGVNGVGIPECIRQGEEAARAVFAKSP